MSDPPKFITKLERHISALDLPSIPSSIHSQKYVTAIATDLDIWRMGVRAPCKIDWRDLATIEPLLLHTIKLLFSSMIETLSGATVQADYYAIADGLRDFDHQLDDLSEAATEEFAEALEKRVRAAICRKSKSTAIKLRKVFIKLYEQFAEYDVPFLRCDFLTELEGITFKVDHAYKEVMSLAPNRGPLSRIDEIALIAAIQVDPGSVRDRCIVALGHAWGLRPIQLALLNEGDFNVHRINEVVTYTLMIPRSKQHGGRERGSLKIRRLDERVGQIIGELIAGNQGTPTNEGSRPLFFHETLGLNGRGKVGAPLTVATIYRIIATYPTRALVISPRTNEVMKLYPRRLRETFGTRCAEKPGMTKELLAELLDHSSTRSIEVYFNFRENIASEIGKLLAAQSGRGSIKDITVAFTAPRLNHGKPTPTEFPMKFIRNVLDATDPNPGTHRFVPPELTPEFTNIPTLGACAGKFRCGIAPILTCYSCSDFEALLEADHQGIAEWLSGLRQKALNSGRRSDAEMFSLAEVKARYVAEKCRELLLKQSTPDA